MTLFDLKKKQQDIVLAIGITNRCNLRCPSCPASNVDPKLRAEFMEVELLDKCLAKAKSECNVLAACLYTITEPLLHPHIAEVVRTVNKHDIVCMLSSNLNATRDFEELLNANPHNLIISVSGFYQETYGITHAGGNIEKVKKNMRALADARDKTNCTTVIEVYYHRYLHNLEEEKLMREYASELGFGFREVWAGLLTFGDVIRYVEGGRDLSLLPEQARKIVDILAVPFVEATTMWQAEKHRDCFLQTKQVTIDHLGRINHCSDYTGNILGNFLEVPLPAIQKAKYRSEICKRCVNAGCNAMMNTYCDAQLQEQMNVLALKRVKEKLGPEAGSLQFGKSTNEFADHIVAEHAVKD